jgi:cation:H+ antiporter
MVAVAVALLPVVFTGFTVARWEAALFLAYYAAYVGYLLLAAGDHEALPAFSTVMLAFVVPLTVLTLAVTASYELGVRRERLRAGSAPPTAPGRSDG